MKKYGLSVCAERDLNEIIAYLIDEAGPPIARKVLRELRQAIRLLAAYPGLGRYRTDITNRPLRFG
jgi:toxin ParE1/3/4